MGVMALIVVIGVIGFVLGYLTYRLLGKIDDEHLFYLNARGIPDDQAIRCTHVEQVAHGQGDPGVEAGTRRPCRPPMQDNSFATWGHEGLFSISMVERDSRRACQGRASREACQASAGAIFLLSSTGPATG